MKKLIKIIISSVGVALFILNPYHINKKTDDLQNTAAKNIGNSHCIINSKLGTIHSAEFIALNNHSRPKKKRPNYLYC